MRVDTKMMCKWGCCCNANLIIGTVIATSPKAENRKTSK